MLLDSEQFMIVCTYSYTVHAVNIMFCVTVMVYTWSIYMSLRCCYEVLARCQCLYTPLTMNLCEAEIARAAY